MKNGTKSNCTISTFELKEYMTLLVPLNALRLKTLGQVKKKLNNLPDDIIDFNITNIQDYMTKET